MSVEQDSVEIVFLQAPGEPPLESEAVQSDLRAATAPLSPLILSRRMRFKDAAGVPPAVMADVVVRLGVALIGLAAAAATAWISGRVQRRVSIKVDGVAVEAPTVEEVERVLRAAVEMRDRSPPAA